MSLIVPILNEVENVDGLLATIFAEGGHDLWFEVLVADGGATDGTIEWKRKCEAVANVRLIASGEKRRLTGDPLTAAAGVLPPRRRLERCYWRDCLVAAVMGSGKGAAS